jgi:hypothetical protein
MACTLFNSMGGVLSLFSNLMFTASDGSIQVTTDAPGHQLVIDPIVQLYEPVNGVDLLQPVAQTIAITGVNSEAVISGDDSAGYIIDLTSPGSDIITISLQGVLDGSARAGNYDIYVNITCL